jgi:hypothetical protein
MLGSTVVKDAPAPPEVLIPEARDRQRRRYRRSAVLVSIVALVIGLVLALMIAATSGGSGTARPAPKPIGALVASGSGVLVRPVLCFAPPYEAAASTGSTGASPACGASYLLTAAALDVTPTNDGYSWNRGGPDPGLAGYPSTSDEPNRTVLLGARGAGSSVARMVLGPSELRLSATSAGSVVTHKSHAGSWNATIHLSAAGAAAWDRVAQENFHQLLAIDIGGKVVYTSLVQPYQTSFSSLDGKVVISGSLGRSIATAVKG